jgi:chain length determinant protein (polysaccharide antigen chain regulator)
MTQNNNSQVNRSNDPEQIDLLDLVLQLWRGKGTIATFVLVCIVLAVGYLSVAKENGSQLRSSHSPMQLRLQRIIMP